MDPAAAPRLCPVEVGEVVDVLSKEEGMKAGKLSIHVQHPHSLEGSSTTATMSTEPWSFAASKKNALQLDQPAVY
jgi:hypothetical protein